MTGILLLPAVLSLLVLCAHFMRAGNVFMFAAVLVIMGFLGVRRAWAARTIQVALLLGALEWLRTLATLTMTRTHAGQPVLRMNLILGSVALVSALSILPFRGARVRAWFHAGREPASGSA